MGLVVLAQELAHLLGLRYGVGALIDAVFGEVEVAI